MTDELFMLAAVLASPDDDTPRLLYADWLDDHDEAPHAEFIRTQCALAKMEKKAPSSFKNSEEAHNLRRRERDLLRKHGNGWVPKPLRVVEYEWSGTIYRQKERDGMYVSEILALQYCAFYRGFVESVRLSSTAWFEHDDALLTVTPIQYVEFTDWPKIDRFDDTAKFVDRKMKVVFVGDIDNSEVMKRCLMHEWPSIKQWSVPNRLLNGDPYAPKPGGVLRVASF